MWALKSLGTYNKQLGLASAQPTSMTIPQILSSHTQAVAAPGYTELPRMTQRVPPSFPPAVNHPIAYNRLMARRDCAGPKTNKAFELQTWHAPGLLLNLSLQQSSNNIFEIQCSST